MPSVLWCGKTREWRQNTRPRDFETLAMTGQLLPHAGAFTAWTLRTSYPKAFCRQWSHFFYSPEVIDGPPQSFIGSHTKAPALLIPQSCVILEANQTVRRKRAHWAASCRHCLPTTTDFSSSRKTLLGCRDKHEQGLLGNTCFKKWTLNAFSLWHQGPWELSRLLGLPVVLLLTGPRKVKVLMGQAQPPKCKLPKAPLEISGMFFVQSIGYFPVRESCDYNEG